MKQIRNILCVIDTDGADEAIRQANRFATGHNARLTFLAVTPSIDRTSGLFPQFHEKLAVDESNLESRILNGLTERITNLCGLTADEFNVVADAGAEDAVTIRNAEELKADLVVISGAAVKHSESWFGSVANRIIRYTHCSVLLARPEPGGKCIVAATDFSDPAFPAVEAAARESELRHFKLFLIHSLGEMRVSKPIPAEPTSIGLITPEELQTLTHQAREHLAQALKKTSTTGEPIVCHDLPSAAIVRVATEKRADLVVVGTIGRSGIPRLVLGSVAESVAANAPCSVLVVRLH